MVSFSGLKHPGLGVDHAFNLSLRLKKEQPHTLIPSLGLHSLFKVNFAPPYLDH
jgi:hypothetical protein